MIPRFGIELEDVEAGAKGHIVTHNGQIPQGTTGTWAQDKCGKGEGEGHGHRKGGRRRHAPQGAETSGGGWRLRATSRWAALCARIEGGDRVKKREEFDNE